MLTSIDTILIITAVLVLNIVLIALILLAISIVDTVKKRRRRTVLEFERRMNAKRRKDFYERFLQ